MYFKELKELRCAYNQMMDVEALPQKLTFLNCKSNNLSHLPVLPDSLTELHCDDNKITSLPNLPNKLKLLNCNINNLTTLPSLPASLVRLDCSSNKLNELPPLPDSLTELICGVNPLNSLPNLNQNLILLETSRTNLSTLPSLSISLKVLNCGESKLISIPILPLGLKEINCYSNFITTLPSLPQGLQLLVCAENPIKCLPILPSSLNFFVFSNLLTTCVPNIPSTSSGFVSDLPLVLCNLRNNCECAQKKYSAQFSISDSCLTRSVPFIPKDTSYASSISWNFGDGTSKNAFFPTHSYSDTGMYTVSMKVNFACYADSISQQIKINSIYKPYVGKDTTIACYTPLLLQPKSSYSKYQWSNGSTVTGILATSTGIYWLRASNACGTASDSINIQWKTPPNPKVNFKPNAIGISDSCISTPIQFYLKDTSGVQKVTWNFGDNSNLTNTFSSLHIYTSPRIYSITTLAEHLCFTDSTLRIVSIQKAPDVFLGIDTALLCGKPFVLKAGMLGPNYLWQDGSVLPTFTVSGAGKYSVRVQNVCGIASDTIQIQTKPVIIPNIFTPNEDGVNDSFFLSNYEAGSGKLTVWNRWGKEVYHSETYGNQWSPDASLTNGIYFFQFNNGCEQRQGYVEVVK